MQVFHDTHPIVEKTVSVRTPRDKPLQFRVYNGEVFAETLFDEALLTYRFWIEDAPPLPDEWRSADRQDFAPKVVMATVQDWETKSRWFWEVSPFSSTKDLILSSMSKSTACKRVSTFS